MQTIKLFFVTFLICCFSTSISAQITRYYWVGNAGDGLWNSIANWSSQSGGSSDLLTLPTSDVTVIFDENSFTTTRRTVTVNVTANCDSIVFANCSPAPIFNHDNTMNVSGSFILQAGMTTGTDVYRTGVINMLSSRMGETFDTQGLPFRLSINFNGTGSWILGSDITTTGASATNRNITLSSGTLDLNGKNVTLPGATNANFNVTGGTLINMANSTITLLGNWNHSGGTIGNVSNSLIQVAGNFTTLASTVYNNVVFTGANASTINTGVYNKITFPACNGTINSAGGLIADSLIINQRMTYTFNSTTTINEYLQLKPSTGCGGMITVNGTNSGTVAMQPGSVLNAGNIYMTNLSITGATDYPIDESYDNGGNSGWLFNLPIGSTYYWVGGAGNWSNQNFWANESGGTPGSGCIPTPFDNVVFDENSGLTGTQQVTVDISANCDSMTWKNITGTPIFAINNPVQIGGSLQLSPGMRWTRTGVSTLTFTSVRPNETIITNNVALTNMTNSSSLSVVFWSKDGNGGWILDGDLRIGGTCTFVAGSLNFNGNYAQMQSFGSAGDTAPYMASRSLNIANSTIELTSQIYDGTGFNYTGGQPVIADNSLIRRINGNVGITVRATDNYHNLEFITGTGGNTLSGGIWNKITFSTINGTISSSITTDSLLYLGGGSYSINADITVNMYLGTRLQCGGSTTIAGNNAARRINMGTANPVLTDRVQVRNTILNNISITNGPYDVFDCTPNVNSTGWNNVNSPIETYYWVGSTGNWSNSDNWSTSSGLAGGYQGDGTGCSPRNIDKVIFDDGSFTAVGQIVTVDVPAQCDSMSWIGTANTWNPVFAVNNALTIGGSLVFQQGMTSTGAGVVTFNSSRANETILSNGVNFPNNVTFNNGTGSWTLQDSFTAGGVTGALTLTAGNLNTNGQDVAITSFTATSANAKSLNISNSTITLRSPNAGSRDWNFSGIGTLNAANSSIIFVVNTSGGFISKSGDVYNNVIFNNNNPTITQGTYNSVQFLQSGTINTITTDTLWFDNLAERTYTFTAGATTTINEKWYVGGTNCNKQTITSSGGTITQANIDISGLEGNILANNPMDSDTLFIDNINLRGINAITGGNIVPQKGSGSPDVGSYGLTGNNSGWDMIPFNNNPVTFFRLPVACTAYPYTISSARFNPGINATFAWRRGSSTSTILSTAPDFVLPDATWAGDYYLTMNFGNCPLTVQFQVFSSADTLIWTGVVDGNWHNSANWMQTDGTLSLTNIPDGCTDVIIPAGAPNYPNLDPSVTIYNTEYPTAGCEKIHFKHGGEVARTDSLHYEEALIELELNSNQWYMLSAPLKSTYSGDFYVDNHNPIFDLGGQGMLVYMMHFDIANYQTGSPKIDYNWNNAFNTNDIELEAGQGFALFANPRNTAYTDNDPMVFPFPKDDPFHYYWSILGAPTGRGADLDRTYYGRFIYEDDSHNPPANGLVPLSHSSLSDGEMVLVGNPFMAQLDFAAFYQTNQSLIYNEYKLAYGLGTDGAMADFGTWKGGSDEFAGNPVATDPNLTQYIAPMQSFIVYAKSNSGQLTADIENHTSTITAVAPNASALKSSLSDDKELLYITASRGKQRSNAVIVHWNEGDKNFRPAEDSRKLFDERATASVLVYLLSSDGVALDINTTNDLTDMIPIGIRTSALGKISLTFSGMEAFSNKKIQLHDTKENRIINLNEEDEYSFFKMEDALHIENRFFISFEDFTGIENVNHTEVYIANPERNTIRIYSPKAIEYIEILDTQGRILIRENNINNTMYDYQLNTSGVYIVRIAGQTKKVVVQ